MIFHGLNVFFLKNNSSVVDTMIKKRIKWAADLILRIQINDLFYMY
jgi:hypothetical protein